MNKLTKLPRGRIHNTLVGVVDGLLNNTFGFVDDFPSEEEERAFAPKSQREAVGRNVGRYLGYGALTAVAGLIAYGCYLTQDGSKLLF